MEHFQRHLLAYIFIPLIILTVAASFYRFMVAQDYTVGYEGLCDPYTEECYVYCEDEECTEPFYYSWIERNAGLLYEQCGELVTECDAAYECPIDDESCFIYFCDPEFEECDELTEADMTAEDLINLDI